MNETFETVPANPPLPTCTNLPFQAAPTGIQTSSRMSLSLVGRLVTAIWQTSLPATVAAFAEVISACGRVVLARSAQAVSAWAAAGAATAASDTTADAASHMDRDFIEPPSLYRWEDLATPHGPAQRGSG